jgi:hypothetical protein
VCVRACARARACVHVLGSLQLYLNGTVQLQFHAAVNWSYGERCCLLRCDMVTVAVDASRHAVGHIQAGWAGVVPVCCHGCLGLIAGQAL